MFGRGVRGCEACMATSVAHTAVKCVVAIVVGVVEACKELVLNEVSVELAASPPCRRVTASYPDSFYSSIGERTHD